MRHRKIIAHVVRKHVMQCVFNTAISRVKRHCRSSIHVLINYFLNFNILYYSNGSCMFLCHMTFVCLVHHLLSRSVQPACPKVPRRMRIRPWECNPKRTAFPQGSLQPSPKRSGFLANKNSWGQCRSVWVKSCSFHEKSKTDRMRWDETLNEMR